MTNICNDLHTWLRQLPVFSFPYDETRIPENGIYILFEKGESCHGGDRIVRVGTHTGENQLRSRLRQHFLHSNKDRSIFRKNIGRAYLQKSSDPYLSVWELDMTTKQARDLHGKKVHKETQEKVESWISNYMQKNFFFSVIRVDDKHERLALESKIISTVSSCTICKPSSTWLGLHSTKAKIRESGLWLVNELYKEPLSNADIKRLNNSSI